MTDNALRAVVTQAIATQLLTTAHELRGNDGAIVVSALLLALAASVSAQPRREGVTHRHVCTTICEQFENVYLDMTADARRKEEVQP